jgi:diacylglycerol kinase family enzyme
LVAVSGGNIRLLPRSSEEIAHSISRDRILKLRLPMDHPIVERPAPTARGLLVSISPSAGARSTEHRTRQIVAALQTAGFRVWATSELSELTALATEWHSAGQLRCVLACGGDGTAAVVRNHTPLEVPLLLVPLGTENLLGQYISQSPEPAAVLRTVEQGVSVPLDLGRCRVPGGKENRYFLSMISAGFDAEVVRRLHERRRGNITRWSYVQPTLETIRSYQYPELQLYCHDIVEEAAEPIRCRWIFGFNLPLYARGWKVAPDAVATDGRFDVCTFQRGSVGNVARYLWHVVRKSHLRLSDASLIRSSGLRIEAANGANVAYQLDGDLAGSLPAEVDVLPGQLRLLVMPSVARRLEFSWNEP